MRAKECCDFRLASLAGCHRHGDLVDAALGGGDLDAVEVQKHERGNGAGPFVAIQEGVVLDNVKQVRRGHLKEILMEKLAAERRLRLGDGRFKQAQIATP